MPPSAAPRGQQLRLKPAHLGMLVTLVTLGALLQRRPVQRPQRWARRGPLPLESPRRYHHFGQTLAPKLRRAARIRMPEDLRIEA